jgi:hypothetical protein
MLGRALRLATVALLIGCFAPALAPVQAQNLEAGKSPSQIFAGACTACHRSPRGLLRTVPAGSLPGFLREHYTTSSGMASLLSNYLISNGAADTRYGGGQPRPDRGAKSEARHSGEPEQADRHGHRINPSRVAAEPPQGGKPDVGQAERRLRGRNARRLERPGQGPDAAKPAEVQAPAQQANQHGRDGRKARHRAGKRGRPAVDEEPGVGAATPETGNSEAPKSDNAKSDGIKPDDAKPQAGQTGAAKPDTAKDQSAKPEPAQEEKPAGNQGKPTAARPSSEGSSEAAKGEPPKETGSTAPAQRTDPVPPVTPAPPAAPPAASTVAPGGSSAATSNAAPEHTSAPAAPAAASAAPQPPAPEGHPCRLSRNKGCPEAPFGGGEGRHR